MLKLISPIFNYGKLMQNNLPALSGLVICPYDCTQVRYIRKHMDPRWRKLRRDKVIKIELPNFEKKKDSEFEKEQMRSHIKEFGFIPQKPWQEKPAYISCTPVVFESYVAPEGDGKYSAITKEGAKQKYEFLQKKSKSLMAIRKIKSFDDTFKTAHFLDEALDIYKKAHEALAAKDEDKLTQYVTETAYPKMTHNMMNKTVHWRFLESLEPARLVHARTTEVISKENIFAQLTVRFHTQQILAIYDRFGRLMQGSEILRKDVLEYIVFEKHLANEYGTWRVHAKIIPTWMVPTDVAESTYILPKEKPSPKATDPAAVEATLVEEQQKDAPSGATTSAPT